MNKNKLSKAKANVIKDDVEKMFDNEIDHAMT